ncbi:MAG: INTEGRAL MEMBRANE PROTEIN (Rhomboid family), partial [uncultured Chthoniobacterales bacterium]
ECSLSFRRSRLLHPPFDLRSPARDAWGAEGLRNVRRQGGGCPADGICRLGGTCRWAVHSPRIADASDGFSLQRPPGGRVLYGTRVRRLAPRHQQRRTGGDLLLPLSVHVLLRARPLQPRPDDLPQPRERRRVGRPATLV